MSCKNFDDILKRMSDAEKNRLSKIFLYVWKHPLCPLSEILKNGNITKNREDLNNDVNFLIKFECLQQIRYNKLFYIEILATEWEYEIKFLKNMDEMIFAIIKNSKIKHTKIGAEIKKNIDSNDQLNSAKLLRMLNGSDHTGRPFERIFFGLFGNLLQKCKIIEFEERKYHSLISRKALEDIDKLAIFIKLFLEHQEYLEQNVYPDSVLTDKLVSNIERDYDMDKMRIDIFRSSRRYFLKKRVAMFNDYLCFSIHYIKKKYGFQSNKAARNALKLIQDELGKLDMMKIQKLYNLEKNLTFMPQVSIQEIGLLYVRDKVRTALETCKLQNKGYKKLVCMIKKELPGLLVTF